MDATQELNAPYVRNDINTTHAVMSHIQAKYPGEFGEFHLVTCVQEALRANDASVGCRIADGIADKLRAHRERFASEVNLRGSL